MNKMETCVSEGGCASHILNVKLLPIDADDDIIYNQIYQCIFQKIHNKQIIIKKNGIDITITWFSIDDTNTKYYTDVKGLIGDIGVKRHTTELFYEILAILAEKFKNIHVKLEFNVTIPLSYNEGYLPQVYGRGG